MAFQNNKISPNYSFEWNLRQLPYDIRLELSKYVLNMRERDQLELLLSLIAGSIIKYYNLGVFKQKQLEDIISICQILNKYLENANNLKVKFKKICQNQEIFIFEWKGPYCFIRHLKYDEPYFDIDFYCKYKDFFLSYRIPELKKSGNKKHNFPFNWKPYINIPFNFKGFWFKISGS